MGGSQNVDNRKTLSQKRWGARKDSQLCVLTSNYVPPQSHTHRSEKKKKTIVHVHQFKAKTEVWILLVFIFPSFA